MKISRIKAKIFKKDIPILISNAYENQSFTDYIFEKCTRYYSYVRNTGEIRNSDYRVFIPFAFLKSQELNILDFGGGGGSTFAIAQKYFGPIIKSWTVVETPQMVQSASISYDQRLNFVSEIGGLKSGLYDLVICSSSLQYCDDPEAVLRSVAMLEAEYIWITRTALVEKRISGIKQVSHVHKNGPQFEGADPIPFEREYDVEYLMTPVEDSLIDHVLGDLYSQIFRAEEEPDMFNVNGTKVSQWGILLKLNEFRK
jgi:putative methyltransferase (TIGR04325 family)